MPSPYSRYNYSSPTDNFPSPPHTNSTTDALTSLAFTGNTGLLSSSALAALSSRLAHTNGQYNDDPATPSSTFLFSEKDTEIPSFDPYAEEKENQKISRRNHKGSWGGKSREIMYKSSFSFLRIDSAAASDVTHKTSPVGPPIPTNTRQQEKEEELDDLAALPKPIPRIRQTRTRDDSPLRRWTLAMADVSDEVLVQELEKMRMEARVPTRRRRRHANTKSPTTTSSSGGHTFVDSPVHSGESDQKAIVHGGPEEAKWREELVRLGISPAEKKSGEDSGLESEGSQSESCELEGSPLEFNIDDAGWKSARRALLCCRELVRTERSYQARLRQLLAGETDTPPPVLVFSHVLALLHASEALLARLEDDPSAWGVSAAFVGVEEEVEAAFVAWCGVVGALFEGDDPPAERQARRIVRSSKSLSIGRAESGRGGSGKRSISSVSLHQTQPKSIYHKRSTSFLEENSAEVGSTIGMFTAALGTGLAYNIAPPITTTHCTDEFGVRGQKPDQQLQARGVYANATVSGPLSLSKALKRMTVFSSATTLSASAPASPSSSAPPTMSTSTTKKAKKEKKPAVRELAIQPTQRVMRYVLQYRGAS
ncbi:hypothetical protein BDY19DRAFT_69037 [Irpex rosettiformis]|uniref:Uncharacterized protein n=1 Tax=Irpex rosettiformis TaxID=378272 RepID=A0ACB8ULK3_9APHY|nr:hypothetical protein BDY19DRAFT_69037 [Irpex rosettiformis]